MQYSPRQREWGVIVFLNLKMVYFRNNWKGKIRRETINLFRVMFCLDGSLSLSADLN